ncbi:FdtA/QdtA family cupin domain-containing protein [Candidatus Woesebacteria bacterium]|nr:FdtA/QdtA family cupin domain-containing protein [Candidatus Woesebacteria bacterium]
MDKKYKVFTLKNIQAPNFLMTPLELKEYIGFEVKRVYFISNPIGNTGNHAHRQDEDEIFIQMQGKSTICVDDGSGMEEIVLTGPKSAIVVPHMVWHGFKDLSPDCIILALTSTNYDPSRSDYCEDYEEFKKLL